MARRISTIRQVIQIDELAFGSHPITKAGGAPIVLAQSLHPLNTEEKRTLLAKGKETTTS